ncbi:hypothetical protein PpBr36_02635 [Pyricularia pennisetigena]|uniref:hypothetical protein n=1 Tax=Pyricularia pennisetigena TaxID=1578925 RepID=UPI001153288D|nr:hypothetical protein PpBr36_02635 [Pyricularia pennisetigena]TLS30147.1 hypothetical protein PpBr36_02635 [Pyricularia pennisetigena]
MDPYVGPSIFMPVNAHRTNINPISSTKERVGEQWAKCREVQELLSQLEIRDVVFALGINEVQAAELQGCIFALLATGPIPPCFAAESMAIRLAKERWPDLLCWDEVPSIWLTEAMHECVELVKRGGSLVKEVSNLKERPDGEHVSEKAARPVPANQHVPDQQQNDLDLEESIEEPSAITTGNDRADICLNSLSKDSEQTVEEHNNTPGDEFFEPMSGLELQCEEPISLVIATPTKQSSGQGPLVGSAQLTPGHDSRHQNMTPVHSSSPGLFVTPEREYRTNRSATDVPAEACSSDVDIAASEPRDRELDEVVLKKAARLSPEIKEAKAILDCKFDKGLDRQMYLVRWIDYPKTDDSWELIEHLTEYVGLVVEYNKQKQIKGKHSSELGIADTGSPKRDTAHAHTGTQSPSPKANSKVIPANHVLLRMLGQSSHGATEGKRSETTTGTDEGAIPSSQAPSPPPEYGRGPIDDLALPDTEDSSAQPEESTNGIRTAAAKNPKPAMSTPSSMYSQSRLLPTSSPLSPRKMALPAAALAGISTTGSANGSRSASPTPSDPPLHKPRVAAFPMVGPGWKRHGKTTLARSHSASPGPVLAEVRGPSPFGGDVEVDGRGLGNEACAETSQPTRPASTDRVLRGSSDRKAQEKPDSGPFKHIKFVKNVKTAAPDHDRAHTGEKSSRKQPSTDGAPPKSTPVTSNKAACQPAAQKTKPSNVMSLEDYCADELADRAEKKAATAVHKMVKPAPTLQKPHQTPRRKLINLKTGAVTYLDQARKPDAQPDRAGSTASTPASTCAKSQAGLDPRVAENPQAQRPSTQGSNQAGAKRKRSGDDLPPATHASKRTNLFGP